MSPLTFIILSRNILSAVFVMTTQHDISVCMVTMVTGGCDDTLKVHKEGKLMSLINPPSEQYDYDLVVIGGGSGGLAAAKVSALVVLVYCFVKVVLTFLFCVVGFNTPLLGCR